MPRHYCMVCYCVAAGGDSASSQPLPSVQLPVDASEQAAEAGKEDGGSGAGKKKAPAKDDRTWIQVSLQMNDHLQMMCEWC